MAANVAAMAWSIADEEFSFDPGVLSAGELISDVVIGATGGTEIGGITGKEPVIGGKTPDIDEDVIAAIALAAAAAL